MNSRFIIAAVLGVLVLGLVWFLFDAQNRALEEQLRLAREKDHVGPGAAEEIPASIGEIDRLLRDRPEVALKRLRRLADGQGNGAERRLARERLSGELAKAFERRRRERDFPAAAAFAAELQRHFPSSREAKRVRQQWANARVSWAKELLSEGDLDRFAHVVTEVLADPRSHDHAALVSGYEEILVEAWRMARKVGDQVQAERSLFAAAQLRPLLPREKGALQAALGEALQPRTLMDTGGELLRRGEPSAALVFFRSVEPSASRRGLALDRTQRARLEVSCEQAMLGTADRLLAAGRLEGDFGAQRLYSAVRDSSDPRRQAAARLGLLQVRAALAGMMVEEGRFPEAEQILKAALRKEAWEIWDERARSAGTRPWDMLPREVAEALERKRRPENGETRQSALRDALGEGELVPPIEEVAALRAQLVELYGRWGIERLKAMAEGENVDLVRTLDMCRTVLRAAWEGELAAELVGWLRRVIRKSHRDGRFGLLVDLIGFHTGEVGLPGLDDPFREELRSNLQSAAEKFGGSAVKRVFLLSLMADLYPDDPAGRDARLEATRIGLELVASHRTQPVAEPDQRWPSSLPGHSVVCIDNASSHHLLAFYDGPERFFVRFGPYRRGSLVLQDGRYDVAVVVTSDGVFPFRGEQTYRSETLPTTYFVQQTGGASLAGAVVALSGRGPYELVRTPPGSGPLRIDPESCLVSPTAVDGR